MGGPATRPSSPTGRHHYIALTQLQADAFVTLDQQLARAVKDHVTVAGIKDRYRTYLLRFGEFERECVDDGWGSVRLSGPRSAQAELWGGPSLRAV